MFYIEQDNSEIECKKNVPRGTCWTRKYNVIRKAQDLKKMFHVEQYRRNASEMFHVEHLSEKHTKGKF